MTRRARALTPVLGIAAVLAAVSAAWGQPGDAAAVLRSQFLSGTHAFRRTLYDSAGKQLKPLKNMVEVSDPADTLIVVLGDPSPLVDMHRSWTGGLYKFVWDGGALLVATDHATPRLLRDDFGVWVNGIQLKLPEAGDRAYRGILACPFVAPFAGGGDAASLFEPGLPLGRDQPVNQLASNLPSYLEISRPSAVPLVARLPQACTDGRRRNTFWPFAAGDAVGDGRALIMADHDVFINMMMLQSDNANLDFAYRCADWLLTRPGRQSGRRHTILYVEDRVPRDTFDIPLKNLPAPPIPPPETLMGLLDETVHRMEEEGTFARMEQDNLHNRAVDDLMAALPIWDRTKPEWKLWTIAVIVASGALGFYGLARLGAFRHRLLPSGPSFAVLLAQQAPTGAVMAQRQAALLRDGNLWEAARGLARDLFLGAGASPDAGAAPPGIDVRGSWWRCRQVRRRWGELWRLAHSDRPVRVSPAGFARLAARVRALQAALHDGTIRTIHPR
jgi:hypothetical protein